MPETLSRAHLAEQHRCQILQTQFSKISQERHSRGQASEPGAGRRWRRKERKSEQANPEGVSGGGRGRPGQGDRCGQEEADGEGRGGGHTGGGTHGLHPGGGGGWGGGFLFALWLITIVISDTEKYQLLRSGEVRCNIFHADIHNKFSEKPKGYSQQTDVHNKFSEKPKGYSQEITDFHKCLTQKILRTNSTTNYR